ncbi:MAG: metal ABC transporter permease [Chloroflexi bacterium]|nr:metal ABC transporter permease [Chloroflexota bacterium]MBK6712560.1 metal ABC transporter permease [Chloroflexota bacterium]MBK7178249.1 metal ABC transporter permease [Chloroflexota bacterium]MBK7916357.1 metal ABC transporter permease [Chloroflexota bacterium]MBK8933736.1 metal ABC transporter permease [Chloroflexota bacterium]
MMTWLLEPLQFSFIVRALIAAVIVGIVCSVLGTYVVLRGMAFFGDALAHTILPGVVIAFLLGWPLAVGALIFGVLTALGIGVLTDRGSLKEDTAIGVVFAGLFALGVALLSASGNYTLDLAHFLFGNLLGVTAGDLWVTAVLGAIVLLAVFLFYKEFLVVSFDAVLAVTLRLPTTFLRYLLLILIAVTIVVSLQVVGIALMLAMFVTPAAAASLLTRRLPTMMGVAALIGAFSGVAGLYASYYMNIASGPAVVLVATFIFLIVFLFAPGRGVLLRSA